ncbi:MAG: FAD-binding oxidoreductase [Acidimicrobiales bacterium]
MPTGADVVAAHHPDDVLGALADAGPRGVIARGLGRCYGDAAQNAGGVVVDDTGATMFRLDPATGICTASAGVSIDRLLQGLVPRGFFVPVTPGTRFVTVGGAIASDIHGKNHHKKGSWCDHVLSMQLAMADGSVRTVTPEGDPDLFWATAGGMGLTGIVLEATFRCPPIASSRVRVDTFRLRDLDETMQVMADTDDRYDYTVAWIDMMATGRNLGRSVLTSGGFAAVDDLPAAEQAHPLAYDAPVLVDVPPVFPSGVINKLTIKAFNELWFRKAPVRREGELQSIPAFFHPLDMLGDWNRVYGPRGFLQWQIVLPFGEEERLRRIVERLAVTGSSSLVNVLKRFGPNNAGMLSFPTAGWTLSVDVPVGRPSLAALLDELDEVTVEGGGRTYLAKDSRVRAELLEVMYPRLDEWRDVRERVDPDRRLRSDLGRRLGLL